MFGVNVALHVAAVKGSIDPFCTRRHYFCSYGLLNAKEALKVNAVPILNFGNYRKTLELLLPFLYVD